MLFANMAALVAKGVTVQFTILAAADGKLEVNVIPSVSGGSSDLNLVPKSFVATAQELDAEFPDVIAGYAQANLSLMQQLEDVKIVADAAGKEASEKAAKASTTKKPATTRATTRAAAPAPSGSTLLESEEESDDTTDDNDDTQEGAEASTTTTSGGQGEPVPFTL